MSTADKLNKLLETKEAIKQAIIDKGGTVGDVFADYPTAIQNIQGGGGSGTFVVPAGMKFGYSTIEEFPEDWDWSEVEQTTNFSRLFNSCNNLIKVPKLTITDATDTSYMFDYCDLLTELDMSDWDISKVAYMNSMFHSCDKLKSVKWGKFDTSSNKNFQQIFDGCFGLETIPELDCSSNTSTYSSYNSPLGNCTRLRNFGGFKNINKSIIINNCFSLSYESLLNIINGLADGVSSQTLTLFQDAVNQLSDDDIAIATNKGWSISPARTITSPIVVTDLSQIPRSMQITMRTYDFSQYSGSWKAAGSGSSGIPYKGDIYMFEADVSNTTDASYMLGSCSALNYAIIYNTGNITNMRGMLKETALVDANINEWDTSKVVDMSELFYKTRLENIDLKGWETSNVTQMHSMFLGCEARIIDLRGCNLSNVTNMRNMFHNCNQLIEVYMDGDVSNVTSVTAMFPSATNGKFYYNPTYDYSKIIAELPATWTAVPLTE